MEDEFEEAKLSVGSCQVKGLTSGELRERMVLSRWKAEEFDGKIKAARSPEEKDKVLRVKAKAVTKLFYRHLAECITNHNFRIPGGSGDLGAYLPGLSEDDIKILEEAINRASSVSPEEARDLPGPSETGNPQSSSQLKASLTGSDSSNGSV